MDNITREFIEEHLNDDVNKLALSKFPQDVNKSLVLRQIQARQLMKKKLPSWSENGELLFPQRLSLEQCSSELTAIFKSSLLRGDTLIDLSGGMGVDTSFLSDNFKTTFYVEMQTELCELARHNFSVLKKNIKVINSDAESYLEECEAVDCIYIDPARRDEYGRKMVSLHDCSPDVTQLYETLSKKTKTLMIKLSPMLDIEMIKKQLKNIDEIKILSVKNECKEILLILNFDKHISDEIENHAVKITATDLHEDWNFEFDDIEETEAQPVLADGLCKYLYEPGVACMKAAPYKLIAARYNVKKLHKNTHLYTSDELIFDFPGRIFKILGFSHFDKKVKKELLKDINRASVVTRNFPLSADDLRKNLALKEGDEYFVFGTTVKGDKKVLILGQRIHFD